MDDIESLIRRAAWFSRCGKFAGDVDAVAFAAVASSPNWEWLPTSRDQLDPVHGVSLGRQAESCGLEQARRDAELLAVRRVLEGLRSVPTSLASLVDGPHDYTLTAKGGAQFAARMAVRESLLGKAGFWHRALHLFADGYWPCGLVRDSYDLVVF